MSIEAELQTLVRARSDCQADIATGDDAYLVTNSRGDLLVARALPDLAELVRMRQSYVVSLDQAGTAVAPLVALPTTAAGAGTMSILNGEQDNGKIYILDSLFCHVVVAAAAATPLTLAGMLTIGKFSNATAPVSDLTPRGTAGQAYKGSAVVDLAYAGTLVDDGWQPFGTSAQAIAASIGMTYEVPINGLIVIPPGHFFTMGVIANTVTTITVKFGMRWHEVQLPIG